MKLDTSVAKALFLGNIIEENLFPFPQYSAAESETIGMVVNSIDKAFLRRVEDFKKFDRDGAHTDEFIRELKELGLFGLVIPEDFGGIGLSSSGYARAVEEISRFDGATGITVGAHCSIGMKGLLLFGTPDQQKRYLPRLATGEIVAAFCLTEAQSGSDAASIKTSASKNSDGTWTLNGEKIWISNGAFADFFTVFARTESQGGKISAFIIERGYPGVSTGPKEDKMGIRASATTTVTFQNVKVPAENLLGAEGVGFKIAMAILNNGRTGLGGGSVGAMRRCMALATKQAQDRKQFGKSIAEFGLVKEKLGLMAVDCYATESMVRMLGHLIDSGCEDYSVEAAISKVFGTEALWRTANEALQIAGGNGFMREFPYEMIVRDCRINMIFEGTNEILRLFVGLSGMKDAGQYLKEMGAGAARIFNDPIKGFGVLSGYATRKLSQLTPLGRDRIEGIVEPLRADAAVFEEYTVRLAGAVEAVLRRHGKEIVEKQFATKRMAEIAIDLFVGLATLSRVNSLVVSKGEANTAHERAMLRVFSQAAKQRMAYQLNRNDKNEDELVKSLADALVKNEGYNWNLL